MTPIPTRRILIVEDHDAMWTLLGGTLRSLGFEVEAVSDARAAIRQMDLFDPYGVVGHCGCGRHMAQILDDVSHYGAHPPPSARQRFNRLRSKTPEKHRA